MNTRTGLQLEIDSDPILDVIVMVPKFVLHAAKRLVVAGRPEEALQLLEKSITLGTETSIDQCMKNIDRFAGIKVKRTPGPKRRETKKHWKWTDKK